MIGRLLLAGLLVLSTTEATPAWAEPDIQVVPSTSIDESLFTGESSNRLLTISNLGSSELVWQIERRPTLPLTDLTPPNGPGRDFDGTLFVPPTRGAIISANLGKLDGIDILWDLSQGQALSSFWSTLIDDLTLRGAKVTEKQQTITSTLLDGFDVFWSTDVTGSWSATERAVLKTWIENGGSLLLGGDNPETVDAFNQLLQEVVSGLKLSPVDGTPGLTTDITSHPTTDGVGAILLDGNVAHITEILPPAGRLFGDVSGLPAGAWSEVGLGRMIVITDELFANGRIGAADGQLFGNQIFDWFNRLGWLATGQTAGTLAPAASVTVDVGFDAFGLAGGIYEAELVVLSNDGAQSEVTVPVTLTVVGAPDIAVEGTPLDFGDVVVGESSTLPITVRNLGSEVLTVTSVSLGDSAFSASLTAFTVAPGEAEVVDVTFVPAAPGMRATALLMSSDDPDEGTVIGSATGTGILPPATIELAAGFAAGQSGDVVLVPLIATDLVAAKNGDASRLAGLDLLMDWDPAVATLQDVLVTPATATWALQFNASNGQVDIATAGLDVVDVVSDGVELLQLEFVLGGPPAIIPLMVSQTQLFDLDQVGIDHLTVDGQLSVVSASDVLQLALGNSSGQPGQMVDVPFSVQRLFAAKAGDPSRLAGIDFEASWDSTAAALVGMTQTSATANWTVLSNPMAGHVDVSMAGLDVVDVPTTGIDMLHLSFQLLEEGIDTPLTLFETRAFDVVQEPIVHQTQDGFLSADCLKGDVVRDGEINSADGIRTLLFAVGSLVPSPLELCAADMNSDGVIDVGDVVLVLQAAVGELPPASSEVLSPRVYAFAAGLDAMHLRLQESAGVELELSFDPQTVDFIGAQALGSGTLVAANEVSDGLVRLGVASSLAQDSEIELQFTVTGSHATVQISNASAFDSNGEKLPLDLLNGSFTFGVTAADDVPTVGPTRLLRAMPNPFNPRTQLRFVLAAAGDATLGIYNVAGRLVRSVVLHSMPVGSHALSWDGRDDSGLRVSSGAYIVRLDTANGTDTTRIVLLK